MPKRPWTTSEERVCNEALRMRAADATDGEIAAVIPDRSGSPGASRGSFHVFLHTPFGPGMYRCPLCRRELSPAIANLRDGFVYQSPARPHGNRT